MIKDKLKDDIIRTICFLNSDISNKDRNLLIELLNSIVDYTNNTELEQELAQLQQKYNELVTNINKVEKLANETKTQHDHLYTDVNNIFKPKINSIDERVTALENSSQS